MRFSSLVFTALTFLFIFVVLACPPAEKTPQLYRSANLFVRYLSEEQEFKGQASFYEGELKDSLLSKQISGGVAFMGSNMEMRVLPTNVYRYAYKVNTEYINPSRFSFNWGDDDSVTTLNLEMNPVKKFTINQASLSNGIVIDIEEKLKEGESILLFFTNKDQQARQVEKIGPTDSSTFGIPSNALINLELGTHQLYLVKKSRKVTFENGISVSKEIEYYTASQTIEIVE